MTLPTLPDVPPIPAEPAVRGDLGAGFANLFELTVALDDAAIHEVFRIRHEVYCRDLGWEPLREDEEESDAYDRHAFHCLLRLRATGESVGCSRLILARPEDLGHPLPFEESCRDVLDPLIAQPARMPRQTIAEISRLAVLKTFRQRRGEAGTPASISDEDFEARNAVARFPYIPVALYLGAVAVARRFGVEHVYMLTEPRMARHFVRVGFDVRAIGGAVDHHGLRVPSELVIRTLDGVRPMIGPLNDVIVESVESAFAMRPQAEAWRRAT